MKLLGVMHVPEYLSQTIKCIDDIFTENPPESMMLELPVNFGGFDPSLKISEGFFYPLSRIYSSKGTKIIYGDVSRTASEMEERKWLASEAFLERVKRRDSFMINSIRENNPSIVIVGRAHADEFKKVFPEAYYVTLEDWFLRYCGKDADKIINLLD